MKTHPLTGVDRVLGELINKEKLLSLLTLPQASTSPTNNKDSEEKEGIQNVHNCVYVFM